MSANYGTHQDLMKQVIMAGQNKYPTLRLFPMVTGMFYTKRGTPVRVGAPGFPDLAGFMGPLALYVEIKSGKSRIKKNDAQGNFRKMCKRFNVAHIEATSVEQFLEELDELLTNAK